MKRESWFVSYSFYYKVNSIGRVERGQAAPSFKPGFYKLQQTAQALNQMLLTAGTMARPGFAGALVS